MIGNAKRNGNALLLILVMAMVITILGATLTTAIAYTTKQNSNSKNTEDLVYAAESGLEITTTKLKNETLVLPSAPNADISFRLEESIFKSYNGIEVNVKIINKTSYYLVESVATKNTKSKKVSGKIVASSSSDIYRYVLCAEKMDIKATGTVADQVTLWSVEDKPNTKVYEAYNYTTNTGTDKTANIRVNNLNVPEFKHPEKNKIEIMGDVVTELNTLSGTTGSGVVKASYTPTGRHTINIYLINSPDVIVKTGSLALANTIIISNGKFTIKRINPTDQPPSIHFSSSTLFSKEFIFDIGSFTSDFRFIDNIVAGNDTLNIGDITNINSIIASHTNGWTNGIGAPTGVGTITDIEYN